MQHSKRTLPTTKRIPTQRRGTGINWGAARGRAQASVNDGIEATLALLLLLSPVALVLNTAKHPRETVAAVLGGAGLCLGHNLLHLKMDLGHAQWKAEHKIKKGETDQKRQETLTAGLTMHAQAQLTAAPRPTPYHCPPAHASTAHLCPPAYRRTICPWET